MQELKCPKCGEVFYVDEQGYAQLANQIRDKEFEKELKRREEELNEKKDSELQIVRLQEEKKQEEKIKKEMEQWQETVAMITNNRKIEKNKRLKQYDDEYRLSVDKIQRKKDMDVAENRRKIANLEESIAQITEELNQLSIFKFRRKEELRNNIESYKKTIQEYKVQILSLENKAQKDISAEEMKCKKKVKSLEGELDKEFVVPENPEEIERKKREQARKEAIIRDWFDALYCDIEDLHVAAEKSVETKIVFDALDCLDEPVTVTELSRCNYEVGLMSPSAILSYLQALVNEGIVEIYKEGKAKKYMVSSDCSKKKNKNPEEIERKKREQAHKEAIIRDGFNALYCDIEDLYVATKKSVETKIVFDALDCFDKPVTLIELSRCNYEVGSMSPSAILSYLQALVNEGIVETYKEGKVNKYMVSGDCSKK